MVETDELYVEVKKIRWHQEAMDGSLELLVRAERDRILPALMDAFGAAKQRARVYLAIDGQTSVQQLSDRLGVVQPNISREIGKLREAGLLEIVRDDDGSGKYYKKKRIDDLLGLSVILRKKFNLDAQGNPDGQETKMSDAVVPQQTEKAVTGGEDASQSE